MYDLIIVGSGPAGLAAALSAKRHGLDFLVIERGVLANTINDYPIARRLFSTPDEIELLPGALTSDGKPTREDVLGHYADVVTGERIEIRAGEEVRAITRAGSGFTVVTDSSRYEALTVLVAIGGFGRQRKLNVAGEGPSRVLYNFVEAGPYAGKDVLVVGGGNSAAEAALSLAEAGARVTLSIRRHSLEPAPGANDPGSGAKIKPWVLEPLLRASSAGTVNVVLASEVLEVRPDSVILQIARDETSDILDVACDHVFALIGADPDTVLLEDVGVEIAADGRPVYDLETYETNVDGLFVAGHLTRQLHMKNAVEIAPKVVGHIAAKILAMSAVRL